jgi:peptide deformylase
MAAAGVMKLLRMGHPVLRQHATPFKPEEIISSSTKKLVSDMKLALRHHTGVGIAAPQIGVSKQLLLLEIPEGIPNVTPIPLTAVFNPKLEFLLKHETILMWESCLSVPSLVGKVPRYNNVILHYLVRPHTYSI